MAYEIARRGGRVRVIDRRDVGRGATGASAGVLAPYLTAHEGSPILGLAARSLALYDEFVSRVVEDSGSTVRYVRNGTLEAALNVEEVAKLESAERVYREMGVAVEFLDQNAVRVAEPQLSGDVQAGLVVGGHGYVGATDLTKALRRAAGAHGVTFSPATSATRILNGGNSMRVETASATLSCDTVVMAAGSWSGQVEADGDEPVPGRPDRGQLLHPGWPASPPDRVIWAGQSYLGRWRDGSVLVGATVEEVGFDERATVTGVRELLDRTCRLVPTAGRAWFQGVRVGLRPGMPDDLPVIGPSPNLPRLIYATGHFRNGVLLAPLTAALVADLVLDDKRDAVLDVTEPVRFVTD